MLTFIRRRLGLEKEGREWLLEMMPKHSVCAEIGVLWGEFSRLIVKIVQPEKLHLIDPWKYEGALLFVRSNYGSQRGQSQERMDMIYRRVARKFGKRPNVQIHRSPSLDCVHSFPDNYFDWIYVDGDHRYEGVKKDLEMYYSKVKPGGLVAGDDYARKKTNWTQDGVTRAVDDILTSGLYQKVVIRPEDHQFILRRPD